MTNAPHTGHVAAFIDIGTNSIRMLVVRLNPNFSYTVISQEKEVVRLGEQEFTDSTLKTWRNGPLRTSMPKICGAG